MKQLLTGLHYCHVNQVLHRDIKGTVSDSFLVETCALLVYNKLSFFVDIELGSTTVP